MNDTDTPQSDATPIERFLMELAQKLHNSGDTEAAKQLSAACACLSKASKEELTLPHMYSAYEKTGGWNEEELGTPYAYSAYGKLEIISDAVQAAMEIIDQSIPRPAIRR